MPKFRYERTNFGFHCWQRNGSEYIYFGHFMTKKEAQQIAKEATA